VPRVVVDPKALRACRIVTPGTLLRWQLRCRTLYQDAACPHRGVQPRADKRGSVKHSFRVKTIDSINEFSAPRISSLAVISATLR
jgi:hypothetical protein